jgi:hypothetical protein
MIKWNNIKKLELSFSLFHDLMMILLVLLNFLFVFFDSLFRTESFKNIVLSINADIYNFYSIYIHDDFMFYDLLFVIFFLVEFLLRWIIATYQNQFVRWYYFPLVYWYDLLGCIPIGSFRAFRLLRLITMALKLHKIGVIDIKENVFYQFGKKYFNIFVNEVSNRVVVNVLNDLQKEVKSGTPVAEKIVEEAIIPQKEFLVTWLSQKLQHVTADTYSQNQEQLEEYCKHLVKEAMGQNLELKQIESIPIFGSKIASDIEKATSDITYNVINGLAKDVAANENNIVIKEITEIIFDSLLVERGNQKLNDIVLNIINNSLEIIKKDQISKRYDFRRK